MKCVEPLIDTSPGLTPLSTDKTHDGPTDRMSITVCKADDLKSHWVPWNRLVETAIEPNVFFEPALLIAALDHQPDSTLTEIALVYAETGGGARTPVLCGLFPITNRIKYRRRPLWGHSIWIHQHCFYGAPLIRSERAEETLHCFFNWLESERSLKMFYWPLVDAQGKFASVLTRVTQQRSIPVWQHQSYPRALHRTGTLTNPIVNLSGKHQKEVRRLWRRLETLGNVRVVREISNVNRHLDTLLSLERKGWKGKHGHPIASSESETKFVRQAVEKLHHSGQLIVTEIHLDQSCIASILAFRTADHVFCFKTAYDENYAKYSPGIRVIVEMMQALDDHSTSLWCDGCCIADHPTLNRLWDDRRVIQHVWTGTDGLCSDLLVGGLSVAGFVEQRLRHRLKQIYHSIRRTRNHNKHSS